MKTEKIRAVREQALKWEYDYNLIQSSLQGDEDAWNILYRDALPAAWNTVRKSNSERVLSEFDMEDIVQEAFLRCYERRENFVPISRFSTWVCGFVRYVALERKRGRYTALSRQEQYSYAPEPSFPDPETNCILKEKDFCLWLAFDSLTKPHRLLLSCYVLEWWQGQRCQNAVGDKIQRNAGGTGNSKVHLEEKISGGLLQENKGRFWLSVLVSKNNKTHKVKICHSERSIAESKNLRISLIFAVKSVPRSFDSLRSLRMTTAFVVILLFVLIKADNHKAGK